MSSHLITNALSHGCLNVNNRREQTVGEVNVHSVHIGNDRFQGLDIGRQGGEVVLEVASDGDHERSDLAQAFLDRLNVSIEFFIGVIEHGVGDIVVWDLFVQRFEIRTCFKNSSC